jgi:hypothetical protein
VSLALESILLDRERVELLRVDVLIKLANDHEGYWFRRETEHKDDNQKQFLAETKLGLKMPKKLYYMFA